MVLEARDLGARLRLRRGTLNLTQPELATRAGVSLAYLGLLEADGLPALAQDARRGAALRRVAIVLGDTRLVAWLDEGGAPS
jgi:transcriptional regulator with XRE-family HTH domain